MPTTGPNQAGAVAEFDDGGADWTNVTNAITEDSTYATAALVSGGADEYSNDLDYTTFGTFATINNGDVVTGVTVEVRGYIAGATVTIDSARLIVGGSPVGSAAAVSSAAFAKAIGYKSTGVVPIGDFGTTLSGAQANAAGFGVRVGFRCSLLADTLSVDCCRVTLTYAVAPVNTVAPAVTGTEQNGETLTTDNGTWDNAPDTYTYEWQRSANGTTGWAAIPGETAATYDLTDDDVAEYVRCEVTATNAGGSTPANSDAAGPVLPLTPVNTVAPVAGVLAQQGSAMSKTAGTWTPSGVVLTYQWQRSPDGVGDWDDIDGATTLAYTPVAADVGNYLRFVETATNAAGAVAANSNATNAVLPPSPVNTVAPVVSGTPTVGETLSCTTGTWTNSPTGYAYEWQSTATPAVGGSWLPIAGAADAATYDLTADEVGLYVRCLVTASNAGGGSGASSNVVGPVAAGGASRYGRDRVFHSSWWRRVFRRKGRPS